VLQVGGKTRGKITVPADATKVAIEALTIGSALAQKYIAGQTIKKWWWCPVGWSMSYCE
jgi:leucyl-tRNA synthetase